MSAFVIDASASVAIVSPDEQTDVSLAALKRLVSHGGFAPSLWLFETANALRFKWSKAPAIAREAIARLHSLPIDLVDVEPAVIRGSVLTLAQRHNLTVYDASYLHVAVVLSLPLATLDKALIAAAPRESVDLLVI